MPESPEEEEKRRLRELEGKNVAFYQTLLSTWIETRMERDRAVITLSAAGIGLLVTILTTRFIGGWVQNILIYGALVGFVGAILIGLKIYELNADHLEDALKGGDGKKQLVLRRCDKFSKYFFGFGIGCMVFLVIAASLNKQMNGENMNNSKKEDSQEQKLKESIKNVHKLHPDLEVGKSLEGINALSPEKLQSLPTINQNNKESTKNNTESGEQK